ncbi:septum formation inhibitor Maf [Aliikangiella marina]|uniref:dTTP/UTP pyrophosphatase n=1 Tax=Aliikangiella marina TaxID=1712262 RepID=A0A545TDT4_9GAMM|nr:Maf family protein [Aliikangiella marina]TQV75383.1 septum formation inhibitor Maf [Aliikangiella marina]
MHSRFPKTIFLASQSPRRQELLAQVGVKFKLFRSEIDESVKANELPLEYVKRMAKEKALSAWQQLEADLSVQADDALVLTADTSVVLGTAILGKPVSPSDAKQMLKKLSNTTHEVITSVAVKDKKSFSSETSITEVQFCQLNQSLIDDYVDTGEGVDKAGGYAIQGLGAQFVKSINGSYTGVVGLPLYETCLLLDKHLKGK